MDLTVTARRERRDAAANRERIIQAARKLFASQGVEQTTMNEIAQAAHVGVGTLYRRFAHKGEICIALLQDDFAHFMAEVERHYAQHLDDPLGHLEYMVDALLKLVVQHTPLLSVIQEASSGERRPELFSMPHYVRMHDHISTTLQQAHQLGHIIEIETPFVTDALLHIIAPPLVQHAYQGHQLTHERIMNTIRQLFIEGLRRR
jgi:AcrR family transcriptional regulator